jgi:predicted aconitase with swiveling domain
MPPIILKGRKIVEGYCKAEALVSTKPIGFLGGVDPADGKILEKHNDLSGECVRDKVLCFPHGHGSTVGSYVLYSLAKKALAPKAIVNRTADPVVVIGAIIANIPMVDQIDIEQIRSGDLLEVDADNGLVEILKRKES